MPLFSYKAVDHRNRKQTGKIEKDNEQEVRRFLNEMDYYVIEIKSLSFLHKDLTSFDMFNKLRFRDLSIFCRQMSQIMAAGASLGHSMKIMLQQSTNAIVRSALIQMIDMLKKGDGLAACMATQPCFPELLVGMVRVGEVGSNLPGVLENMSAYYKRRQKSRDDLVSLMIYPAIIATAMLGVIILALILVIPNYSEMFVDSGAELPWITTFIIDVSAFFSDYYILLLAGIALFITVLRYARSRPKGKYTFDWLKLNVPIIRSIYIHQFNLQFTEALSLMLNSGQQLLPSLGLMRGLFNNAVIDSIIDRIIKEVSEGEPFSSQLYECKYFLGIVSGIIGVGEDSERLAESISQCVEILSEDDDLLTSRVNKIIEPAIIITLGLVLAVIMMAIMLPVFSLATYI